MMEPSYLNEKLKDSPRANFTERNSARDDEKRLELDREKHEL